LSLRRNPTTPKKQLGYTPFDLTYTTADANVPYKGGDNDRRQHEAGARLFQLAHSLQQIAQIVAAEGGVVKG
jgi:hypothetical protein